MRKAILVLTTLISLQCLSQAKSNLPRPFVTAFNQVLKDFNFKPDDKKPVKKIPSRDTIYYLQYENFTDIPFYHFLHFYFTDMASGKDSVRLFFKFEMYNIKDPRFKPFENSYLENVIKKCNLVSPYENKYVEMAFHFSYDGTLILHHVDITYFDTKLKKKYGANCVGTNMTQSEIENIIELNDGDDMFDQ